MSVFIGGPALRRTEPDRICLWMVLREVRIVEVFLFESPREAPIAVASSADFPPVTMGEQIHVYLLQLRPESEETFPLDTVLYYDIAINGENLAMLGLTSGAKRLTYGRDPLPSLVIPEAHRHILEGSCRKPHSRRESGAVQRDQLIWGDEMVSRFRNDVERRPTMLVLTGDQIYADDVATSFSAGLGKAGVELTGTPETMPPRPGQSGNTRPDSILLHNRRSTMMKKSGFTSGHRDNHLMTFGEYMAMYLAVWGGLEIDLPSWDEVRGRISKQYRVDPDEYKSERNRVRQFLSKSWRARRLMANTPTITMFDDHEITDDWNLTERNRDGLREPGSLARRVLANGLAAYWVCQGWGNDPDGFGQDFQDVLARWFGTGDPESAAEMEGTLLERYWSYTVYTNPVVFAVDTRTDRTFGRNGRPHLLSERGFDWLRTEIERANRLFADDETPRCVAVLSPAPVFGFKPMERFQALFSSRRSWVDAEYWSASRETYEAFLEELSQISFSNQVVFLSGDVHYSYAAMEPGRTEPDSSCIGFYQITSSSLCNRPTDFIQGLMHWIEDRLDRTKVNYLVANGASRITNGHNSIASLLLENGIAVRAVYHFFHPTEEKNYAWVYGLEQPVCRVTL